MVTDRMKVPKCTCVCGHGVCVCVNGDELVSMYVWMTLKLCELMCVCVCMFISNLVCTFCKVVFHVLVCICEWGYHKYVCVCVCTQMLEPVCEWEHVEISVCVCVCKRLSMCVSGRM